MANSKYVSTWVLLLVLQTCMVYSTGCSLYRQRSLSISYKHTAKGSTQYHTCWVIENLLKHQVNLQLKELVLSNKPIDAGNLTFIMKDEGKRVVLWSGTPIGNLSTLSSRIEIHFKVQSSYFPVNFNASFALNYQIVIEDDVNVEDILPKTITQLRNQRLQLLDWRENTLKALTALYLAGNATFDGTDAREELMLRRAELRTASALQNKDVSENELSSYINYLKVTCNSPRQFAFHDLVQKLLNQLETSNNFTHPVVYLALCNANESWPQRAVYDLLNILNSKSEYIFVKDIQAFAMMAVACKLNQTNQNILFNTVEGRNLTTLHNTSIHHLMQQQLSDGSFGSIHETAVAAQALIASGKEYSFEWNSRAAVKFIIKELNSSKVDFKAVYLSLPLLNKKTLADIAKRNCTGNPRNNVDLLSEITVSKIEVPSDQVRYSLFIGDKKELIRTTTFRIPDNFTAYQVMSLAKVQNLEFNFQWRRVANKMYVYSISDVYNDPESGKFWLLYIGSNIRKPPTPFGTKGPDEIFLKSGDHLIMWYKTTQL